jgi:hypothetical protein
VTRRDVKSLRKKAGLACGFVIDSHDIRLLRCNLENARAGRNPYRNAATIFATGDISRE